MCVCGIDMWMGRYVCKQMTPVCMWGWQAYVCMWDM